MLSRRQDQENVAHARHDAVLGKERSLNGVAPKTPARRMQKILNDENNVIQSKGGKDKDKIQVFATPAAPKSRAPLGAKTTNAKATAFFTPARTAVKEAGAKPNVSPRLRKSKIRVHDAEVVPVSSEEIEEREIEYMPPREIPLPDYPDEDIWPHDREYPQFEGENLTKGWATVFYKPSDSDDEDFAAKVSRIELAEQRRAEERGPSTITSKSAASLLSKRPQSSFAAETSSSRARKSAVKANPRHLAAKLASNTSLGYSKGRSVSEVARVPQHPVHGTEKPAQTHHRALPDLFLDMSDHELELTARAEEYEEAELKQMEADFLEHIDDL